MFQVLFTLAAGSGLPLYDPRVAKIVIAVMDRISVPIIEAAFGGGGVQAEVLKHVSRVVVVLIVFVEHQAGSFVGVGVRLVSLGAAEAGSAKEIVADAGVSGAGKAVDLSSFDFRFRRDAGVDKGSENGDDDGKNEEHCGDLTYESSGIRKVIGSSSINLSL